MSVEINKRIYIYVYTGWGKKNPPLRKSEFFCHLSLFRSEILQACRGERLTYSDQVLCENVQSFKSYRVFTKSDQKLKLTLLGRMIIQRVTNYFFVLTQIIGKAVLQQLNCISPTVYITFLTRQIRLPLLDDTKL